jgi:hypothetical protein
LFRALIVGQNTLGDELQDVGIATFAVGVEAEARKVCEVIGVGVWVVARWQLDWEDFF